LPLAAAPVKTLVSDISYRNNAYKAGILKSNIFNLKFKNLAKWGLPVHGLLRVHGEKYAQKSPFSPSWQAITVTNW